MSDDIRIAELEARAETLQRLLDGEKIRSMQFKAAAERAQMESQLKDVCRGAGITPAAIDDVVSPSLKCGRLKLDSQGKLFLVGGDGQPVINTKGEYDLKPWVESLRKASPWYFAGAAQQAASQHTQTPNPWSAEHWNLTKQSRVAAASLDEARRMAAAAGSSLDATKPPSAK